MIDLKIIKEGTVSRITDSFFSYQSWPSACIDENGVIYVVCSGFRMGHVCPFGKTVMYKSRDGGESFSLPVVVNDHYLDDRDPGILYLGRGDFIVTRCSHPASSYENQLYDWLVSDSGDAGAGLIKHYIMIPGEYRTGGCFYRLLHDYGETADGEKRIPVHSPHGPVLLKDGTVFYLGKEVFSGVPEENEVFSAYISSDRGETFIKTGECPVPEGFSPVQFHEVHCGELSDGGIMALFRTHLTDDDSFFTVMKSVTYDRGRTWSEWEKTGICGSPPHLCKLSDGGFALTYGRRRPPYGICGRYVSPSGEISDEEFRLADCDDDDIGYPATVELPDGTLFTVYYARYRGDPTASLLSVKWIL